MLKNVMGVHVFMLYITEHRMLPTEIQILVRPSFQFHIISFPYHAIYIIAPVFIGMWKRKEKSVIAWHLLILCYRSLTSAFLMKLQCSMTYQHYQVANFSKC